MWGFLQTNIQSKGKTSKARQKTDTSDLLLFQQRLEDRIQLFEKEKEMESSVMNKVRERTEELSCHFNYINYNSLLSAAGAVI